MVLEVSDFVLADLIHQQATLGRYHRIWFKIVREKQRAILIEHLEREAIWKFDRRQSPANSFD